MSGRKLLGLVQLMLKMSFDFTRVHVPRHRPFNGIESKARTSVFEEPYYGRLWVMAERRVIISCAHNILVRGKTNSCEGV
jgi:hypothetical protein